MEGVSEYPSPVGWRVMGTNLLLTSVPSRDKFQEGHISAACLVWVHMPARTGYLPLLACSGQCSPSIPLSRLEGTGQ